KFVNLKIIDEPEPQLNEQIRKLNQMIDDLISKNYELFLRKSAGTAINNFDTETAEMFKDIAIPFFQQYRQFAVANLQLTTNFSRNIIFEKYLKNQPLLTENEEYMVFIKDYFKNFTRFFATATQTIKIEAAINVHQNADSLLSVFNKNQIFSQLSQHQKQLVL